MKNLLVSSFLGFTLLYITTSDFAKELIDSEKTVVENPLDQILGEKILDDGSLRKDNFDSILRIKASFLKDSSELYVIQELADDLFLLTRKNFYINNIPYSLFVKTKGDRIVFYHPLNNFHIKGAVYSKNNICFIGDDYTGITNELQATYAVKISCMDSDFKKKWSTVSKPNSSYFFFATGLKQKDGKLIAGIRIQNSGGSSMCVDYYDLVLSKTGKPVHSLFLGTDACKGKNTDLGDISTLFE